MNFHHLTIPSPDYQKDFHPVGAGMLTVGTPIALYSTGPTRHYFACRLRYLLSLTALGWQDQSLVEKYPADLCGRQINFLNCLTSLRDERFTCEIRILSSPDPFLYTRGRITVAFLCRFDGLGKDEAERCAGEFFRLLESMFDEYEFEVATTEQIKALLKPFDVRHLTSITRRCARETLDTLRNSERHQRQIGFPTGAKPGFGSDPPPDRTVFHVFRYIPTSGTFNALFKLMLHEPAPIAVSCRLRPTVLLPEEEEFLKMQIAHCERYAQVDLGEITVADDLSKLWPTLKEQARAYQRYQSRMLHGLRNNAALLTLEIASPAPISRMITGAVGCLVTAPTGSTKHDPENDPLSCLAGGYETVLTKTDTQAVQAFENLDLTIPVHPLAPPARNACSACSIRSRPPPFSGCCRRR